MIPLAHAGNHPNILWTKDNWIPQHVQEQVRPSFRWSPAELAHMIRAVPHDDYGYGTPGESLDVLMYEDPDIVGTLRSSIDIMLEAGDLTAGVRGASLVLSHSRVVRHDLSLLIENHPTLLDDEWFREIAAFIQESGRFSLYY